MSRRKRQGPLGDEAAQAELRGQDRTQQARLARTLAAVMGTPEGRAFCRLVIYDEAFGRLEQGSFTGSSQTFELEGRRAVAIALVNLLREQVPDLYIQMEQERLAAAAEALRLRRATLRNRSTEED